MEKQKLIYVESKALFSPSEVSDKAIVFIKDTKEIWTHGVYFSCSGTWTTPITLSLTGDTTGSVSIDGSGNVSIATTTKYLSGMVSSSSDCNSTATILPRNVTYYPCVLNGAANGFPTTNNANGILSLNVHDYSYTHLLGFSSNGNIYHRRRNGGTWETSWKTILNSSNYTNYLNNTYLPLSGGIMVGLILMTRGSSYLTDTGSGYSMLGMINSGTSTTGMNSEEGMFINVPFTLATLRTSGDNLYHYNHSKSARYLILDTNNYSTYALPLSGGTMKGALNFANNTWNKVGDGAYMGDCNVAGMVGIKDSNAATPGFAMYNNSGTLLGKLYANGTGLYWSNAKILAVDASGTSTLFVMGDGSLYSDTVSHTRWTKTTTSGIAWFPIADVADDRLGTALFMVRAYAHSSIIFTVTKGYDNGNINVLAGGGNFNNSYAYIRGVRLIGNVVEIGLNAAATIVSVLIKVILPTFTYSLRSSLVESTSTTTPYVQYDINSGGNHNFGIISSKFTGNLIGNADTASKWKDARTITLTGDVTGSVTLDGSSNVTLTTATAGTGTTSFLKCPDKRNSYPALIVTSGGNIGAAFMSASKLGLSDGSYYDAIILRGYGDSSGGSENALLFSKSTSSVYHSQYAFGSTTTWGTMYKFLDSRNYSSYALPLSGGTMTGAITLTSGSDAAYAKTALSFIKSSDKSEQARIGTDTANGLGMYATGTIYIRPNVTLGSSSTNGLVISGSLFTYNGNAVLTSSNYTNYTIGYANSALNTRGYAGIIDNGKLYYNSLLSFAMYAPDDNGGKVSYELIAELPNYGTGTNTSYVDYGISGFIWSRRGGNCSNSSAYPITAIVSIGPGTNSKLRVPVTTHVLVPFIVKYNDVYYLALRKDSSGAYFYFMGQKYNLLTTTIKVNDASLIEEIKGPETETSTARYYYNNGNPQEYLHAGNYKNFYPIKLLYPRTFWGQSFDGSANVNGAINIVRDSSFVNNYAEGVRILGAANEWAGIFLGTNGTASGQIATQWNLNKTASDTFRISRGASSTSLLEILNSGNVGINNTSPSYKLDVGGDIYSSGYIRAKSGFIKTDSSDSYVLLGGGGHKLLSDFVLTSSLNNYVTLSTDLTVSGKKLFNNQLIIRKDVGDTDSKVIDIQHDLQLQVRRDSNTHSVAIGVMPTGAGVIWAKANGIGYNTLYLNPYNNGVAIGCGGKGTLPNLNDGYYFHIFGSTLSNNSITATKFIKSGGTSSLFLKADGSLDSTSYLKVDGTNGTSDGVSTLLNKLNTGTATPVDADYYICQYAGGGTTTTTYVRRPISALYTYIKNKLSLNPDERFIYATSATSNQYGTTEATGSSTTLTRTLFWRDNDRAKIGMYVQHSDNLNYGFELASSYDTNANLTYRRKFNGSWETLQTVLTSSNYNNYSPTLTGTGASGTWAINISGVAASASKVANALTILLNGGTTAGTNKFVYDGSGAYTINITPAAIGASATSHTHDYLPLSGGTLGSSTASYTDLFIKSSTAKLRLTSFTDSTNYIQSGNSDFTGNATLRITGYNSNTGSNLYFNFANIYCRAGNYTNIDSGNYSSYALPLSGGTLTGTLISRDIRPSANVSYSLGTSSYYYNYVYANYFKKNGSSDSYVLLGGGGHKAVSDFAPNNVATLSSSGIGNSDLWTLVFEKSYPANYWYAPTTMFYIRSASAGCGILCFYNYWASGTTQLNDFEKEVWFFGAGKSETGAAFGGPNRDINDYFRIYIDKANYKYCMYYNRYNDLSLQVLELLFFTVPEPGEYLSTGTLRSSFFTNSTTVVDLPTESSTLVRVPIKTAYNHDRTIKTTKSIYASSFYENSDIRLKENVRGIDLSDLTKLVDLVQFNFKDSGAKKYGVIAQLLELVGLQNLVYENNGNKAVDYISLLVLEIQRLRNEIGELKLEINKKS